MHSFLVSTPPDFPPSPDILHVHPDPSIGITEVRHIQSFLSKKPTQSPQHTVVIHQAHLLTLPAQQALLKTLEEPPPSVQIYLVSPHPDQLLPTILSRVQHLSQPATSASSASSSLDQSQALLTKLLAAASVGERMQLFDQAKFDRPQALTFLADLEHLLHQNLHLPLSYPAISTTRTYLQSNVSVRLCLDYLAQHLPLSVTPPAQ